MTIVIESYYYLFFRLYRWYLKHFGASDLPHLNATLILGILAVLNWMTFVMGLRAITGYQLIVFTQLISLLSVAAIGVIMFTVFFRNQRYKTILVKFEGSKIEKPVKILSTAYPIATFILLFLSIFFAWGINTR